MSETPNTAGSPTVVLVHGAFAEVERSHAIVVSQPQAVTDVILEAVATVG